MDTLAKIIVAALAAHKSKGFLGANYLYVRYLTACKAADCPRQAEKPGDFCEVCA